MVAGAAALAYAWLISRTGLAPTAVQFISPLIVIMAVHLAWLGQSGRRRGFAIVVYRQSAVTAAVLALVVLGATLLAPQPAQANAGDVVNGILMVMFCGAVIAIILGAIALLIWVVAKVIGAIFRATRGDPNDDPDDTLRDFGSLALAAVFLVAASAEGLPRAYGWSTQGHATATRYIAAPPDVVWATMGTATSPEFALPVILQNFPQPVAVSVDQGVSQGAQRVVEFAGREGAGALTLHVTERSDTAVTFTVQTDTTPFGGWIAHDRLVYRVVPDGDSTRLDVTLHFDRQLSPAWVFGPMMKGAAYLGMDVLARDVRDRSQASQS